MVGRIDLNSDLGEHPDSDLDEQIMPFVSSCNIACGGHIGDETSVRRTIRLAKKYDVAIGAHPSFPDPRHFGREVMDMEPSALAESVRRQIQLVLKVCEDESVPLHHVKPHGALYNLMAIDRGTAALICDVVKETVPHAMLYGLAHSFSEKVSMEKNQLFVGEAFADRAYETDRTLRSRSKAGAVITNLGQVLAQVEELTVNKRVFSHDWIDVRAETICLHSDTLGAVTLAKRIHEHLVKQGIHIAAV